MVGHANINPSRSHSVFPALLVASPDVLSSFWTVARQQAGERSSVTSVPSGPHIRIGNDEPPSEALPDFPQVQRGPPVLPPLVPRESQCKEGKMEREGK